MVRREFFSFSGTTDSNQKYWKIYRKCYSKFNIDRRGFSALLLCNNIIPNENRLLITQNIKYVEFYLAVSHSQDFCVCRCKIRVATADQRFQLTRFICFFFPVPGLINPLLVSLFLVFSFVPVASYLLLSFSRVNSLLGTRSRGASKNTQQL